MSTRVFPFLGDYEKHCSEHRSEGISLQHIDFISLDIHFVIICETMICFTQFNVHNECCVAYDLEPTERTDIYYVQNNLFSSTDVYFIFYFLPLIEKYAHMESSRLLVIYLIANGFS